MDTRSDPRVTWIFGRGLRGLLMPRIVSEKWRYATLTNFLRKSKAQDAISTRLTKLISLSFLLGIELTAEDVEEPFGSDGDDLDLSRFCRTIRASTDVILNPKTIPSEARL
jgi:hypothetical protein